MATDKFRIGITRDNLRADGTPIFDERAFDLLKDPRFEWEFLPDNVKELTPEHAQRYDALAVLNPKVPGSMMAAPNRRLKIVARIGVAYASVDVPACTANGVILTNTPDGVRRPVATSILLMVLALSHKLRIKDTLTRTGRWAETTSYMGDGLTGKTVGSMGLGNIGSELFRLLAPLNMVHVAYDPYAKADAAAAINVRLTDKDTVLRESDFVCINTPLTPETRGMMGDREFGLMKPTAYFINTARGPIVDEAALIRALQQKTIAGAGLDVFAQEPVGADNPLLAMDNVIVTPHSLCWTDELFRNNAESAFRSIVAVATRRTPTFVVNRDVLAHPEVQSRLAAPGRS